MFNSYVKLSEGIHIDIHISYILISILMSIVDVPT
jgi:hypothetical protein